MTAACGKASEPSWSRALPLGFFDLTSPVCRSTGKAPEYPAVSYRVALFDFDQLAEHTLAVSSHDVKEVFRTETCRVETTRSIYQNYDGFFSTRHDRKYVFEPTGCTLSATAQGTPYKIGPDYSDLLKDGEDRAEELPYEVTTDDDHTYRLKSKDLADLNDLWGSYGCAKPDRIEILATTRP